MLAHRQPGIFDRPPMPHTFDRSWKLPAALAAGLLAGGVIGWLAGGHVATGLALVAVAEIVLLLTRIRHQARHMMTQGSTATSLQHDRFMTRSRRIASSLRDLRNAAGSLPDAVVLLDNEQHVRWFNHAAEDLLGLRRPQDRGAHLDQRLSTTELAGWLKTLGDDGKSLHAYFVSIDPERDTPQVMNTYISNFSDRIVGISGDPEKVYAMAKSFGIYWKKVPTTDGDYTMDHTASVLLLNAKGDFAGTIAYGEDPKNAVAKLKRLAEG